jgi:NADPH:quinone reductase-like Zn-dependent oxidoreductase
VRYEFLFMQPSAAQLDEITKLLESCAIKPNIDRVFPFSDTKEGLAYVETGRARGKVVISSLTTSQAL